MAPLKTSVLIFLILCVSCQCIAAFYPSRSKECCYNYKIGKPLPVPQIASYFRTPSDCDLEAVVFVMKTRKTICANPRASWVKKTVSILEKRKILNGL